MYGVFKNPRSEKSYFGKIPALKIEDGYHRKHFSYKKYSDPKEAAEQWVREEGQKLWGIARWTIILEGGLHSLRNGNFKVCVIKKNVISGGGSSKKEKPSFYVHWRVIEEGKVKKKTKWFSLSKYGCLVVAEQAAHLFSAQKRAELMSSELNLPAEIKIKM